MSGASPLNRDTPLLLGGRCALRQRGPVLRSVVIWLPVVIMLSVIARESTAAFGSTNTSLILRKFYQALFGPVNDGAWEDIHHYIRKTGHFLGYGTLGLTWLRAFLLAWLIPLQHRTAAVWRRWSLQMAICCTAFAASLDEVHQSYIPDRTGLVTDILLDTTGAIVLCGLVAVFWLRSSVRHIQFQQA